MLDNRLSFFALAAVAAVSASAEMMDRPVGIRIGQRMTLKPYLSFSASYNSNVAGNADGAEDVRGADVLRANGTDVDTAGLSDQEAERDAADEIGAQDPGDGKGQVVHDDFLLDEP